MYGDTIKKLNLTSGKKSVKNEFDEGAILDQKVEDILFYEDQINKLKLGQEVYNEENENLLLNLTKDIEKNSERLDLVRSLIQSEEKQTEKEIKQREEERSKIINILSEIEEEINNARGSYDSSSEEINFEKKKIEETKNIEEMCLSLSERNKKLEQEIQSQKLKKEEIQKSVIKLKDEREQTQSELVNLISEKETIQEIIHLDNFKILKNMLESYDDNYYSNDCQLNYEEILYINIPKFVDSLSDNLHDLIVTSFAKNKLPLINFNLPKEELEKLFVKSFSNCKDNIGLFQVDDLFILLTKKMFDLIFSYNINSRNILREINLEKLKIYIKYFTKVEFYDSAINEKETFLTKDYKVIKKEKKKQITDIESKIASLVNKKEKLENQNSEAKIKLENISKIQFQDNRYKSINSLDNKLHSLIEMKNNLNEDIKKIEEKSKNRLIGYEEQISEIEKINFILRKKKIEIETKIEKSKLESNEEIIKMRSTIADKFKEIKDHIKKLEDDKKEVVNSYIDKLNKMLCENQINQMISPVKQRKNLNVNHSHHYSHFIQPNFNYSTISEKKVKRNLSNMTDEVVRALTFKKEKSVSKFNLNSNSKSKHSREFSNIPSVSNKVTNKTNWTNRSHISNRSLNSSDCDRDRSKSRDKNIIMVDERSQLKNYIFDLKKEIVEKQKFRDITNSDEFKKVYEKILPLTEPSFCYKRFFSSEHKFKEFDPIFNFNESPESLGFNKHFISFDETSSKIILFTNTQDITKAKEKINQIKLTDIEKTIVSRNIKNVIKVNQIMIKLRKENIDPDEYFENNYNEIDFSDQNIRVKYLTNKMFNMVVKLSNGFNLELIFINFLDFKNWLNGFATIIKHRDMLVHIAETK